jgi:ribonuclease HI
MGSVLPQDFFLVSNVKAWIKTWSTSTLDTSFHPSIRWKDVFPLLCWSIWSARNKVAMEGALLIPSKVLKRAKSLAIDFFFSLPTKGDKLAKSDTLIGWQHSPHDFVKLNTDGSVLGNPGLASPGGILRDSNGNWLRGFSHKLGITNSLVAELWGVKDGLLLARDLNIRKLIIESDAKSIMDILKTENLGNNVFHPYSALINDCKYLILSFKEAFVQHAHCESNFCADILAKEGHNLLTPFSLYIFSPTFVVS